MSKRIATYLLATAAAAAMLAVTSGTASSATSNSASAASLRVVPIIMKDPGCHWFRVAGKDTVRLVVNGKTAFRNLDEDAIIFTGKNFRQRVAVKKTLTITKPGAYRIVMVGQHAHDNTLVLVVK